ncbi:MAG: PilW family protein [Rubrivivax sp.]|nr:PilW family protein [Rubrivivax sp.]
MTRRPSLQRGVSLVELMVALVIGLMTVLAVVQMMSTYGRQQRLGGSVSDAQNSAMMALNTLGQDLQRAGHSLAHQRLQDCSSFLTQVDGAALANFSTAAVSIVDGGSGPDTLRIRFAESARGDVPVSLAANMTSAVGDLRVATTYGVSVNDLVLVTNSANQCTLRKVTSINTAVTPPTLAAAATSSPNYNPAAAPTGWVSYTTATSSQVFTLGRLTQRQYSIDGTTNVLRARELLDAADTPVAEGIVDLQAQYGITSGAGSDTVTQWVDATGSWVTPSVADRKRIKAVRVAIVARAAEVDASNPSTSAITLWPAVAAGAGQQSSERLFTPTGDARRHRYRVLRTVVPLKNILWATLS